MFLAWIKILAFLSSTLAFVGRLILRMVRKSSIGLAVFRLMIKVWLWIDVYVLVWKRYTPTPEERRASSRKRVKLAMKWLAKKKILTVGGTKNYLKRRKEERATTKKTKEEAEIDSKKELYD